jgi:pimeloyl-ACP methyl ester carboxylesterase
MKFTFMRRGIAAVAAASLVTIGAPIVATSASAAQACALGATCEGVLPGTLGESPYKIQMPTKFNGTVLMYSHGYRFGTPVPAALATPLGLAANPTYAKISFPAFTAAFGSDVAYVGSNAAAVAPSEVVAQNLLAQGYALAGAGYARQGWASAEGVEAGTTLLNMIKGGGVAGTKKMMVWGDSLGGLISQTIAEKNPKLVAGSLPSCGVLEGPEQAFSSAMTLLFTWKTLVAPNLKVANYAAGPAGYVQALTDLGTVLQTLQGVAGGKVTNSALGFPVAQANLLGGLMAGLPTKSDVYDGLTVNPAFATLGTLGGLAGGFSPASAGANSAAAMLQNVGAAAALGILGRYELEVRIRTIGNLAPTDNANFNDNVNVSYTNLLSDEQRGEFSDTLNATTALAAPLNTMLGTLDGSRGDAAKRFPANPAAVAIVNALPAPKGVYSVPTLLISTTFDPAVPSGNQGDFFASVENSYNKMNKKKRGLFKAAAFYTIPPEDGWTKFDPEGKSPNAALSIAALGGSGVGHCVYTPEQLLGAVRGLNAMVNAKSAKQVTAAKRIVYAVPGVNTDRMFLPDPLKKPLLSK